MSAGAAADAGRRFERCTLLLAVFTGDNGPDPSDYMRFVYVDEAYLADDSDPDAGPLLRRLMDKVDGVHYDACTRRQLAQLDLLFDWIEDGIDAGWAVDQGRTTRAVLPPGAVVTRVVTVTAEP